LGVAPRDDVADSSAASSHRLLPRRAQNEVIVFVFLANQLEIELPSRRRSAAGGGCVDR
jgi:hypothetical protein